MKALKDVTHIQQIIAVILGRSPPRQIKIVIMFFLLFFVIVRSFSCKYSSIILQCRFAFVEYSEYLDWTAYYSVMEFSDGYFVCICEV